MQHVAAGQLALAKSAIVTKASPSTDSQKSMHKSTPNLAGAAEKGADMDGHPVALVARAVYSRADVLACGAADAARRRPRHLHEVAEEIARVGGIVGVSNVQAPPLI